MVEALNTRLAGHDVVTIPSSGTPITSSNSSALSEVKELLYGTDGTDGKVLNIRVLIGSNWSYAKRKSYDSETGTVSEYVDPETGATEQIAYRAVSGGGGHAMTIVGSGDNVWCDINNDNIVDVAELGAFKVANSWGDDWKNNGYIWVSYDALNKVSAVPNVNDPDNRKSIFDREVDINGNGPANGFYYIDVQNEDVYYVGQLHLDTNKRNSFAMSGGRSILANTTADDYISKFSAHSNSNADIEHDGVLVFDYDELCEPISSYISGYNWYVDLEGTHNSASFKITDNLSNVIVDFGSISAGESYMPISLSMGDLNYDGVVDANDTTILNNARHGNGTLSNLQEYLATNMGTQEEDYTISYNTGATWGNGETGDIYQNIEITITNNGDTPIRNWAIRCNDFCGTLTENIWNGIFYGDNIIKNAGYNSDIASGQSVTIGYIVKNPTGETPVFSLCTFRAARTDGYDVEFTEGGSWGSEFIGTITITNTTNEPIMAWELTFDAVNFEIDSTGQFEILAHSGNTYTITGTYNGNIPIPANTSITMQFNGTKTGTTSISNISLTEMRF